MNEPPKLEFLLPLAIALADESAGWIPATAQREIFRRIFNGEQLDTILADLTTADGENANLPVAELALHFVGAVVAIKAVWDGVAFYDKVAGMVLEQDKQLELAEHVVLRLRQIGLELPADQLQLWLDQILDRLTRPPAPV